MHFYLAEPTCSPAVNLRPSERRNTARAYSRFTRKQSLLASGTQPISARAVISSRVQRIVLLVKGGHLLWLPAFQTGQPLVSFQTCLSCFHHPWAPDQNHQPRRPLSIDNRRCPWPTGRRSSAHGNGVLISDPCALANWAVLFLVSEAVRPSFIRGCPPSQGERFSLCITPAPPCIYLILIPPGNALPGFIA